MSSDKINQLFWLYYGQAIKDKAGANFGKTGAFFLATEAQKGPVAGDYIPDEYTYQGLYDIGNNLLATDNLFYNPSALHGYYEAIGTYLNWVDLQGKPDAKLDAALLSALQDQAAMQKKYATERANAASQWKDDKDLGLTTLGFYDWVYSGNAPAFIAAQKQLAQIGSTIQNIQNQIAGPMAATINKDRSKYDQGSDQQKDWPGVNMHGAFGNILSPAELVRKANAGEKVPPPDFQRIPAFNAPKYKAAVQAAMRKATGDYTPENSVSFTIDTGKNTSDFDFGQTSGSASVSASTFCGWFSFNASASHSEESTRLETGSDSTNVSVKITYDTIELVDIVPGSWNIDTSKYKLRSDAPKDVKALARVSQLVIATGLGYEITVGASTASTIDTKYKETSSAGGSISIFGIPIGIGGGGSHSEEHDSHKATWDSASKTFKVTPAADVGFATVVGLVGEKLNIL
ncbi:uncharacterized protein E0L32_011336 [Thyridium curvatum]|uniref:Uncharacterized protein n=1 Tax=Thyridium curvatum TaxID=1093900 RepID=A0A507BHF4_9PEZI|nr:uncharacterized protein E0L32_011336 [Thyridium curvatum]TPX18943.1 hypothetical protein E0L32_011336 [Thyridium curvatum]